MRVDIRKGLPVITVHKKEQDQLKAAKDLLTQIGKYGDFADATKAADTIGTVLTKFCKTPEATPLLDKATK